MIPDVKDSGHEPTAACRELTSRIATFAKTHHASGKKKTKTERKIHKQRQKQYAKQKREITAWKKREAQRSRYYSRDAHIKKEDIEAFRWQLANAGGVTDGAPMASFNARRGYANPRPQPRKYKTPDCNSFVPGTKVLMKDGTPKAIEDVRIGDTVMATDPETETTSAKAVTALLANEGGKNLVELTIRTSDGGDKKTGEGDQAASTVTATYQHPFWIPDLREWVDAGDLRPGMWLRTSAGTHVQVTAVKKWSATQRVHNLTVADLHTYYVLAGGTPVLVHNCDGDVHWVNENANMSSTARAYDAGAAGSRAGVAPALQYYKAGGKSLSQIKFDGFDAANGVMIDRKVSVTTFNKTYRQAMNQSLALEQNGYTGRWEVPTAAEAVRARKVLGDLLITNIQVRVVP
ncbi:polymorphic toxin-type HINT domain-containing protein [Nonomuraea coxensis]|nr:polymorphic toxin-type HINT domain-containing protein [Nonomuraea coxensis]